MRLEFSCYLPNGTCGLDTPYINKAKFMLATGSVISLDRLETNWDFEVKDGEAYLSMEWRNVYLWDIDDVSLFSSEVPILNEAAELLKGAELIELEVEDDAPENYEVVVKEWAVG